MQVPHESLRLRDPSNWNVFITDLSADNPTVPEQFKEDTLDEVLDFLDTEHKTVMGKAMQDKIPEQQLSVYWQRVLEITGLIDGPPMQQPTVITYEPRHAVTDARSLGASYSSDQNLVTLYPFNILVGSKDLHLAATNRGLVEENNTQNIFHEMAHATGQAVVKRLMVISGANNQSSLTWVSHAYSPLLFAFRKPEKTEVWKVNRAGLFFEEAFAELTAIKVSKSFQDQETTKPENDESEEDSLTLGLDIRNYASWIRTIDTTHAEYSITPPVKAAFTVDILSKATGVDLYQLLCQMRVPETQAQSKRQFITTLEEFQPGLYKYLRDLTYNYDDFLAGYFRVLDCLNNNKFPEAIRDKPKSPILYRAISAFNRGRFARKLFRTNRR